MQRKVKNPVLKEKNCFVILGKYAVINYKNFVFIIFKVQAFKNDVILYSHHLLNEHDTPVEI